MDKQHWIYSLAIAAIFIQMMVFTLGLIGLALAIIIADFFFITISIILIASSIIGIKVLLKVWKKPICVLGQIASKREV